MIENFGAEDIPTNLGIVPSGEVRELVRQNKILLAIKTYREQNPGMGLRQAIDVVESIRVQTEKQRVKQTHSA